MLYGFPTFLPSDIMLENLSQTFNGVYMPWDSPEILPSPKSHESIVSNSGSDFIQSPAPEILSYSSDIRNPNEGEKTTRFGQEELNRDALIIVERKQRRRLSNRESAKRSRLRKKKHLENLRNKASRFRIENRGLSNKLLFVLCQNQRVRTENDRLQSEYSILREKLSGLHRILFFRQSQQSPSAWPYNVLMTDQSPPLTA